MGRKAGACGWLTCRDAGCRILSTVSASELSSARRLASPGAPEATAEAAVSVPPPARAMLSAAPSLSSPIGCASSSPLTHNRENRGHISHASQNSGHILSHFVTFCHILSHFVSFCHCCCTHRNLRIIAWKFCCIGFMKLSSSMLRRSGPPAHSKCHRSMK